MNSTTTNDNLKNGHCCSSCSTDLCGYHVRTNSHPGNRSYIHPGDALVILCGIILGPSWGFLAGGIGSAWLTFLAVILFMCLSLWQLKDW